MTKTMTKTALIVFAAVLVLAAVCVAFVCTGTANAAGLASDGSNTGSVQVTYSVEGGWAVTITDGPINLKPDKEETITVEVTKAVLGDGQTISITIESEHDYKLVHGSDSLAYTVKKGATTFSSSEKTVLENIDGTTDLSANGKADLTVKLEQATASQAKYEGAYTDTLNFTVNTNGGD